MNQVRIRDVVEQDESMFEIHKLENIHVVSGINPYSSEYFILTFMFSFMFALMPRHQKENGGLKWN